MHGEALDEQEIVSPATRAVVERQRPDATRPYFESGLFILSSIVSGMTTSPRARVLVRVIGPGCLASS